MSPSPSRSLSPSSSVSPSVSRSLSPSASASASPSPSPAYLAVVDGSDVRELVVDGSAVDLLIDGSESGTEE